MGGGIVGSADAVWRPREAGSAPDDATPPSALNPSPLGLFDSVFHEVGEAIAIIQGDEQDAILVDVNPQFERQMGVTLDRARGSSLYSFVAGREQTPAVQELRRAMSQSRPVVVELDLRVEGRAAMPSRVTVRPIAPDSGEARFICVVRPEPGPTRSEEAAARDIANRLLTFLSHDLRTPLNGILGFSEIMMSGLLGSLQADDYKAYARDIHGAGQDLLRLIDGLLDLSHSRTGGLELCDSIFDLGRCIEACLAASRERAAKAGVALYQSLQRDLPAFRGDEARLSQVLIILLSNAISFTPRGGQITLTARRTTHGIVISCRDTGIGIAASDLNCAFQPYGRIEDTYCSPKAGIGVGLPLVKVLIEQHGGSVTVSSEQGAGTEITIRLPEERLIDQSIAADNRAAPD